MLKNLTTFALAFVLFCVPAFSQSAETKQALTEKALTFYRQGNFEKAIEAAERVVEMEKVDQSQNTGSYVNSLINAARIKQGYIVALQNKLDDGSLPMREKLELYEKNSRIASEIETLLRQALRLNEAGGRAQTAQTADVKSELATLVQKFNPTTKPSVESSRGRIDEAEKLLAETLALNEQIRGKDDDRTLAVVLQTGDFYLRYVNFEKALPFYERYVRTVDQKGAANYPELPAALRAYASILFAGFQEAEAAEITRKLEAITGKKENFKPNNYNFHLRSKDAVAYAVQFNQSLGSENENHRQRTKLLNNTVTGSRRQSAPRVTRVPVNVVVNENGKVVEAVADEQETDPKLRDRAEREVSKWTVRPFSYNGATRKMRGILTYAEFQKAF